MTGPEHYREAERIAAEAKGAIDLYRQDSGEQHLFVADVFAKLSQAHASLAGAAIQAVTKLDQMLAWDAGAWRDAAETQPTGTVIYERTEGQP